MDVHTVDNLVWLSTDALEMLSAVRGKAQDASGHGKRALHRELGLGLCCVITQAVHPLWLCSPCVRAQSMTTGLLCKQSQSPGVTSQAGAEHGTQAWWQGTHYAQC